MRDRLIELLEHCRSRGGGTPKEVADLILHDGWIRLPVRVGQWVYVLSRGKIVPMMVCSILIGTFENYIKVEAEEEYGYWRIDIPFHNSTIDWYLTREEAEKALKETHNE